MNNQTLEIVISKETWQKVALAVGDKNPIHYIEKEAICPGIYLFSEAEKTAREDGRFQLPLNVKGKFYCWVYDNDRLKLDKTYLENKSVFTFFKDTGNSEREKIAEFEIEKILCDYNFNGEIENAREISKDDLDSFSEALKIKNNGSIYSAFSVGRVLERFLVGREGSLLHNIAFNLYKDPILGDFSVKLNVGEETKKRGRKEITKYFIQGEAIQSDQTIGIGFGEAQYKMVRRE